MKKAEEHWICDLTILVYWGIISDISLVPWYATIHKIVPLKYDLIKLRNSLKTLGLFDVL